MGSEVVIFGDPEAAVIVWLTARLGGVEVSTNVPSDRPAEFVKVSLTGGGDPNMVTERAQLTFECWAADSVRASEICRMVKALVRAMEGQTVDGVFVRSVRTVGAPVSFPDPATDLPRYQYTAELNCRYQSLGES
jgi:hypothetical protein